MLLFFLGCGPWENVGPKAKPVENHCFRQYFLFSYLRVHKCSAEQLYLQQ